MPSQNRRSRQPQHLRIILVGCGTLAKCVVRPLSWHLAKTFEATVEFWAIDGRGDKAALRADEFQQPFTSPVVFAIQKYLVQGNIADLIRDGDIVFVCVDNCATVKLISDQAGQLKNVIVILGAIDGSDGTVAHHVRRNGKNLTPPLASVYHPQFITPPDRNPGDVPATEPEASAGEQRSTMTCNMVAAMMLLVFERVQAGSFGKTLPESSEFNLDGRLVTVKAYARSL